MFRHIKNIHFVGIGGIGMSGIAEVLFNMDYNISGSDIAPSPITDRLQRMGVSIKKDHVSSNVSGKDLVVYSSAIRNHNPEITEARKLNIPVIPRAEILSELMRMKEGIAVAGTHGKTTVTSMIAKILDKAGLDPTVVIGGILKATGINAKLGKSEYIVCEADESDKSFLKLSPIISVITNIDEDHLDTYKDINEIKQIFLQFADRVPFYGCTICCANDERILEIMPDMKRRCVTYGFGKSARIKALDITVGQTSCLSSQFTVKSNGDNLGRFTLNIPGKHNVENALAAIAVGIEIEIDPNIIKEAICEFQGVHRRFEIIGEVNNIKVIDDYAHHPREIEVVLKTARELYKRGTSRSRIIAIFQPHLFSRTLKLKKRFGRCFKDADKVIISPIYPAREESRNFENVTGEIIVDAIRANGHKDVVYIEDKKEIVKTITKISNKGDIILTIGAGDINKIGREIIDTLK